MNGQMKLYILSLVKAYHVVPSTVVILGIMWRLHPAHDASSDPHLEHHRISLFTCMSNLTALPSKASEMLIISCIILNNIVYSRRAILLALTCVTLFDLSSP